MPLPLHVSTSNAYGDYRHSNTTCEIRRAVEQFANFSPTLPCALRENSQRFSPSEYLLASPQRFAIGMTALHWETAQCGQDPPTAVPFQSDSLPMKRS